MHNKITFYINYNKLQKWHLKMGRKRQAERKEHTSLKTKMAEISELPKDVVLGIPVLTVTGQSELNLENYSGIIEYTDVLVRIKIKRGQIKVKGRNLQVSYYTNDDMKITGYIETIEYHH